VSGISFKLTSVLAIKLPTSRL